MFILKLICVIAAVSFFGFCLSRFNQHCSRKFGHMFFTKLGFYFTATALAFVMAGSVWRQTAIESHGDQLNGAVLIGIGAAIACFLIFSNIRQTNWYYGVGGSLVQIGLFSIVAWVSFAAIIVVLFIQFLALGSARRVYVINR